MCSAKIQHDEVIRVLAQRTRNAQLFLEADTLQVKCAHPSHNAITKLEPKDKLLTSWDESCNS